MIARSQIVRVKYQTLENKEKIISAQSSYAALLEHEIDHLNGVLMFDRLEGDQRKEALAEYRRIEEEAARQAARPPIRRRLGLG